MVMGMGMAGQQAAHRPVDQPIGRAGIAGNRRRGIAPGSQPGKVGDAAQIEQHARRIRSEQQRIRVGGQGSALAAEGDFLLAEIGHGEQAGGHGQLVPVT